MFVWVDEKVIVGLSIVNFVLHVTPLTFTVTVYGPGGNNKGTTYLPEKPPLEFVST